MNNILKIFRAFIFPFVFVFMYAISFASPGIRVGAERTDEYLPFLGDKKVGIVANQTTLIGAKNLADSLIALNVNVTKILCPEHGFRGDADAGESVVDEKDKITGLPIISLYRSGSQTYRNKPTPEDLQGLDILLFDIQDVGLRFFTNISTMHYVMEVCAENDLDLMILDRPNPHGFYVDGPVLDTVFRPFVGMHPVPVVHGMTMGEYAQMINGERWLKNEVQCRLKVIRCAEYTHDSLYALPVKPSPNLPDMQSIYLYPSICFFEGTVFSLGRGTDHPFQMFGHPSLKGMRYSFTPRSTKGAKNPPLLGIQCFGIDLRTYDVKKIIAAKKIDLSWLIEAYGWFSEKDSFFHPYINTLSGSRTLQAQIKKGMLQEEIRKTWEKDLAAFRIVRKKYLLYPDVR